MVSGFANGRLIHAIGSPRQAAYNQSGSGTTAASLTLAWGVDRVKATTPGAYTSLPANPVAQSSTNRGVPAGPGTGAILTIQWGIGALNVSAAGAGYTGEAVLEVFRKNGCSGSSSGGRSMRTRPSLRWARP